MKPVNRGVSYSTRMNMLTIPATFMIIQLVALPNANLISAMTTMSQPSARESGGPPKQSANSRNYETQWKQQPTATDEMTNKNGQDEQNSAHIDKRAFVVELLKMLYEQYGSGSAVSKDGTENVLEERRSQVPGQLSAGPRMMHQLLEAIGADGDMGRLIDWIRSSLSPSAIPEVATQFVISKLGSVNCPAILRPDKESGLIPRFLLFNEHFEDVPFEISLNPNADECMSNGKLDPRRKTVVLIHGFLSGYTLVDGITNIKNRLLDLNRAISEKAMDTFAQNSNAHLINGSSFVYTGDLTAKISQQMYNVIIVDWFNGANPTPRANYIKSAVNAQVVARLIARFLSALIVQCGTPASSIEIIAHSLGCHVSGFTGKAMNAAGHKLGKITHLDPVGLCFGRLFSHPKFRLSPDDALDTLAVHTSLNIFDNPLDGTHSNFLVNGGRDQSGCGGHTELTNSTTSSISLMFDPAAKFGACSHMRALDLFEEDHSSEPGRCQLVGYRCQSYERFLAGKCGHCDATNSQCRLMSLPPFSMQFRQMQFTQPVAYLENLYSSSHYYDPYESSATINQTTTANKLNETSVHGNTRPTTSKQNATPWPVTLSPAASVKTSSTRMFGAPSYILNLNGNELDTARRRYDRSLSLDKRDRIAHALEKLRTDARTALVGSWSTLRTIPVADLDNNTPVVGKGEPGNGDGDVNHGRGIEKLSSMALSAGTTIETTTALPTTSHLPTLPQIRTQKIEPIIEKLNSPDDPASRSVPDTVDHTPIGGQKGPAGSLHGPLYFLGASAVSTYCLNYYQFRVLVAESRLQQIIKNNGLGSNRLAPQLSQHRGSIIAAAATLQQRAVNANGRDMLHLTVKLSDTSGRFFKGFSLLEHAHSLSRVGNDFVKSSSLPVSMFGGGPAIGLNEPMVELTMLLNSTRPEPQKIGEAIISYYFHQIVLADRVEINYMSNISPEIRAKYSSVLCPVAINDGHQLVKYIECRKIPMSR